MNRSDKAFEITGTNLPFHKAQGHLDEHGRLISPSLHDGQFLGVLLSGSAEQEPAATLHATSSQGQSVIITLRGVHQLAAHDFYEGNIIGTVWAWPLEAMPMEFWQWLMKNRGHAHELQEDRMRLLAQYPQALGIALSSSYGCALVAVCASFGVE